MSPAAQSAFADTLRKLIAARGLTQTELAAKTGIDRVDLNRMVNDKREPKPHEVAMLAVVLKVKPEELASDVDQGEIAMFIIIAQRVIEAEDRLTDVRLELQAHIADQQAADVRWTAERRELVEAKEQVRRDAAERIARIEADAADKESALELRRREQAEKLAQRDGEIVRLRASLSANAATIAALQADKAKESGRALFAGVIGALAGAALAKSGDS